MSAWQQAWESVAARHDVLRASFNWQSTGELAQQFAATVAVALEVKTAEVAQTERAQLISDFLRTDRTKGFDLASAPLWRLTVFPWNDHEVTTVWTFHHGLLDGRSHALVWQEVAAVYRQLLAGTVPEPLPAASSFGEFPAWLNAAPTEAAADYWRKTLRGFQAATDLPSLATSPDSGADDVPPTMETLVLSAELTEQLRAAAQRHAVTLNNLVQAAWALALARYQAVEEVVFGVVRSGRHWTSTAPDERVGVFINTIPFRVEVSAEQSVGEWLRGLRTQQLETRVGEYASTEQIRRWCGLARSTVLFRTGLMFENRDAMEHLPTTGQRLQLIEKTDFPILVAYAGKVLTLAFVYSPHRHPAAQIQTVLRHLQTVLESLAIVPGEARLGELNMLPPEDQHRISEAWQGPLTAAAPPLQRVLESQAAATPQARAVEFKNEAITYAELHARANQLARRLLQFCRPGERVLVVLDRSVEQPIVWLAALKAGLVYAPVDPANPRERLEFYFDDLQPSVLVTQTELLPHLPVGNIRLLCVDAPAERAALAELEKGPLTSEPPAEAAANLLYTSGSTGVPKAAINSRVGLDNFALELRRTFAIGPADRVLQSSATSFDASLFDFVAAFQTGATLVVVPSEQLRPGPALTQMLVVQRISVSLLTPTVMRSTPVPPAPVLSVLISAGEPLTADLLTGWSPGRRVFNVCGPTECSVWFNCEESKADGNRPSIGALVANCRGYILNEKQQPVPVGVPGELYLGGAGVGLGYWNRPELTAEKYLPDPFTAAPNATMYRTGDRVRWLADGRMEYLGRLDFQVKVRGVRVELGEIEAALRRHPAVADAALVLHDDRLLAWFVPHGTAPTEAALRGWLADHIPQIFTPAEFHALPQFPRTRTGKTDRSAMLSQWLADQLPSAKLPPPELAAAERHQVIDAWNQTARPYPLDQSVVDFFHDQVRQRPEAPAVKSGAKVISYAALDQRANRLAHQLLRAGLLPEAVVALRFERSIAFVVSALAVLKAGGSYLPLDVNLPIARQEFLLQDSGARFALMDKEFIPTLADWSGWSVAVEDEEVSPDALAEATPAVPSNPRRRAYVIYTSGSTGQPKGVEIEHHSLTNLVCFYHERLNLTAADRVSLLANPTFDASVADLWPILCAGGTALVPDRTLLGEPDRLIAWLATEGATFSFVPTALGELLFTRPWPRKVALRFLCVGGEALQTYPPPELPFALINSYGPTENTVDATWETVLPTDKVNSRKPSIGRPIANVRAYVLNDEFKPVAVGVAGELFLGGQQVARGYLHRPQLTAERFFPDPFAGKDDARMYRTGDRVRWSPDGSLEFLGRNDDQVQVRGQRVELGEIEAVLRQHPEVREACCRPLIDSDTPAASASVSGVIAHVVAPNLAEDILPAELRQFLKPRLPGYMVPGIFITHPALPLTPQGKVDRAALDAAGRTRAVQNTTVQAAPPDDSLDRTVTELWYRILPDSLGAPPDQTFQQLGGDSLGAVKLLLGVEEITGRRLALSTFLLEPTLPGLCRAVTAAVEEARTPILALHRAGTRPPIFCLYEATGDVGAYFELAAELGPDQPVFGIRSPALHHLERVPDSMEAAARQVRELLAEFHPVGPFALVGYSWAGMLAFEVARQYAQETGFNPFCVLLGTRPPPRQLTRFQRLLHALRWLPSWTIGLARDRGNRWQRIHKAIVTAKFFRHVAAGEKMNFPHWATGKTLAFELIKLSHRYQPKFTRPVAVHLFRERGDLRKEPHPAHFIARDYLEDGGWRQWTGCAPTIHWLDGDHMTVLKRPQVAHTAVALRAALETHFSASRRPRS